MELPTKHMLRAARAASGLSAKELAKRAKVNVATVWRAERTGPGHLTADVFTRIMAVLKAAGVVIEGNTIRVTRSKK